MKNILYFHVNLLLTLSLSQKILIKFWLLVAEDLWQKPDALVRCCQEMYMRLNSCSRSCFSKVSHPRQNSIATRDTALPINIEVLTKYKLSRSERIVVLEIRHHSENPMLDCRALHGNWNSLSLARRTLKDKLPTPMIPLVAVLPNSHVFLPDPIYIYRYIAACYKSV